jgi:hypothetical protein
MRLFCEKVQFTKTPSSPQGRSERDRQLSFRLRNGLSQLQTGTCFEISWDREPSGIASNNNISAPPSYSNLLWIIRRSSKLPHLMDIRTRDIREQHIHEGVLSVEGRTSVIFGRNDSLNCSEVALTERVVLRAKETFTPSCLGSTQSSMIRLLMNALTLSDPSHA